MCPYSCWRPFWRTRGWVACYWLGTQAEGQILLHAADHGAAGRMVAEYANTIGASTIVIGAPTHGGLPAPMDESASRELWRHTHSNVLIVNPDAPEAPGDRSADAELIRG